MIKGIVTFLKRSVTAKGKQYDTYYFYIPVAVATDGLFPFKEGDKAQITIDKDRLIIEKSNP